MFEADVAQAYTSDEALIAGRHHSCHLVIEARVGAAVAGQADVNVNRSQLIDPQAAEVAFDTLAQLMRIDPLDGLDLHKFGLARERFGD